MIQPLKHAMINGDAIALEFCSILNLSELFGGLVNCAYVPVFTDYDTNDYANSNSADFGAADGNTFTFSCLYKSQDTGTTRRILWAEGLAMLIGHQSNDTIRVSLENGAGTKIFQWDSTNNAAGNITNAEGVVHLFGSVTTDGGGTITMTKNGVAMPGSVSTDSADNIDFTENFFIFAQAGGSNPNGGCISELWMSTKEYFTDPTAFATGNEGKDLGADGSSPTGTQPEWYIPDLLDATNKGSAGGSLFNVGDPQAGCAI